MHKVFSAQFSTIYPLYVTKVERKGRSQSELNEVIGWLTGFKGEQLKAHMESGSTLREFFDAAQIHQNAPLITGKICGIQIEQIEDPLMKKIRYLDKLVDELAKGRPMEKILRK
jgi:hypothetical protein